MTPISFRSRRAHARHLVIGAAALLLLTQIANAESSHAMDGMTGMRHAEAFAFGAPGSAAEADRVVNITMNDLSFAPVALKVRRGETIRFVVTNKSGIEHDFTLGDAQTQLAHHREMAEMFEKSGAMEHKGDPNAIAVKPGETGELTWRFDRAGELQFACNVPGHYEAGMKGAIIVAP